jgi:hypothetical protein
MFLWIIKVTVLSILFIYLLHSLIHFFKTTLTVPKIKDLVNTPHEKYNKIFDLLQKSHDQSYEGININQPIIPDKSLDMKNELKTFLKSQMSSETSTPITSLNTDTNYYSYN